MVAFFLLPWFEVMLHRLPFLIAGIRRLDPDRFQELVLLPEAMVAMVGMAQVATEVMVDDSACRQIVPTIQQRNRSRGDRNTRPSKVLCDARNLIM